MNSKSGSRHLLRTIMLIMAIVLCFAATAAFFGCSTGGNNTPPVTYQPPEETPKVHSVSISFNDEAVQGVLSVDVTRGEIQLGADVQKDDGAQGTLAFTSSVPEVATVDETGKVTLVSAGETVITATFGGVKGNMVLVVTKGTTGRYSVTVKDGAADFSTAASGDIITLTPNIPVHKEFTGWSFEGSEAEVTWISGNMFRMPDGNVTVSAQFTDMLYTLTLVGAKVTDDGNETVQEGTVVGYDGDTRSPEFAMTEYKYAYGTELDFEAVDPSGNYMFVGWDANTVNNRIDAEEEITGFVMPDEATTYWANFSPFTTKKLITADGIQGWNTSLIDGATADPVLEGLSGFTVTIPADTSGTEGYNEDIHGSCLNTVENPSQAIRAIFRNRGNQPVTVEIYASYLTNLASSGRVTVQPGEVVTKTFIALLGFQADPWWGFSVRENLTAEGGDVPLDIVMGCADAYPKGDKTLSVTAGTQLVSLDSYVNNLGNIGMARIDNSQGWTLITGYEHDPAFTLPVVLTARLNNLPEFDADDPYVTLYIKFQNQAASDHSYQYTFAFGTDANPLDEDMQLKPGTKAVDFTVYNHGETKTFAIRLPRSQADSFYFSIIKLEYDTPDKGKPVTMAPYYATNFSIVLTYNNGIGFTGEVTE